MIADAVFEPFYVTVDGRAWYNRARTHFYMASVKHWFRSDVTQQSDMIPDTALGRKLIGLL